MDSFEWNKIAGAVLFALLLSVGLSIFSDVLFETEAPESPGYIVAVATQEGSSDNAAPAASQSIGTLLASADAHAGEASAKKCGACHTFDAGGPNKVGPNLYDVVNRPVASHAGFNYDDSMKTYAETAKDWTFEHLNTFLHDPKGTVPGTKMAFPGLKDDQERANVIAYLRSLSDNPAPLPEAAAAETKPETQVASAEPGAPAAAAPAAEPAPAPAEAATAPAEPPAAPAAAPQVAQTETPAAAPAPAPADAAAPAAGDAAKGATFAKRCAACHNFVQGGPNVVGPNLFGVVGRAVAAHEGYEYSDGMKTFAAGGKTWDEATLDTYLANPKGSVPGTKMAFPGVKSEADRANVIAYLKTLAP